MAQDKLRVIPLGGLGEIGMNCLALEWKSEIVLVDCGIQFPDASYSGIELLAPDLSYLRARKSNIRGVVVTHGHDDHIGAIPFLARDTEVDVYSTPFPRGLLENKLSEYTDLHEVRFHDIKGVKSFKVGPFTFHPIPVQHSIIESVAFAIETPVGNIIHTGDFKHDPNEFKGEIIGFEAFEKWGKKGVLLLLSDSTNAERCGHTISEFDITSSFEEIFAGRTGRTLIALFASNMRRVESLMKLSHSLGKKVALVGRSMHSYTKLAHEQGMLDIPPDTLILSENIGQYPDKDIVILLTGSQAEPQSALVRISQGVHKDVEIRNGDLVLLSSRFIPGNERNITSMIDQLYRLGAEVIYESIHQIHVSGHGYQDELLMMLNSVKPKFFTPLHGEYRHLKKHANLAIQTGIAPSNILVIEDGQTLEVTSDKVSLGEKLELKKVAIVDGNFIEGKPEVFQQRAAMAKAGIVFAAILRDSKTRKLVADPQVNSHGLLFREGLDPVKVHNEALEVVEELYSHAANHEDLTELLRLELRRFYKKKSSYKPIVIPLVLDV